jgi:hypothetical protein
MSSHDFALYVFIIAVVANAYCLVRFGQAMRAFTRSQLQLNDMLKRAGYDVKDRP